MVVVIIVVGEELLMKVVCECRNRPVHVHERRITVYVGKFLLFWAHVILCGRLVVDWGTHDRVLVGTRLIKLVNVAIMRINPV